jgi:Na+/H+ antiporter NhaC
MASAGAQCDHVTHVSTQLPYAITTAAVSFIAYIIAGFIAVTEATMAFSWISLPIAIVLMLVTLFIIKAVTRCQGII